MLLGPLTEISGSTHGARCFALYSYSLVAVNALCLRKIVPQVNIWPVNVEYMSHTHFQCNYSYKTAYERAYARWFSKLRHPPPLPKKNKINFREQQLINKIIITFERTAAE